jgi:hypothetical protein
MNSELEGYQEQLLSICQDAPGIGGRLTDEQFNQRPSPERWSIGECFEHLNLTARAFVPAFDEAIDAARKRGLTSPGPFAYPLLERLFITSLDAPPRLRMRARPGFIPPRTAAPRPAADVLREFNEWQDAVGARLRAADGLDLRRARMRSPVASFLRYSLGCGFAAFLAHERRHLWQARHVRNKIAEVGEAGRVG